jgi:hypothetical protein
MAQKIGNVVAANGSFIQDGVEKTRWIRCGVALQTDKGIRIKLDAVPVGEWDGWLAIYEEEQGQSKGDWRSQQRHPLLMTDRSGRTFEEYRELYWAEKKRRKELEIMCRDLAYAEQEAQKQLAAVRAALKDIAKKRLLGDIKFDYDQIILIARKAIEGEKDE